MHHIEAKKQRDLERHLFHRIDSRDIRLALDDGIDECPPLNRRLLYTHLEKLPLQEAMQYHRQLFLWRLNPFLWSLSRSPFRTMTLPITRQLKPDN